VFEFFANAANLEAITPPWLKFRIVTSAPLQMAQGTRIEYQIDWCFMKMKWLSEIVEWDPPCLFSDKQLRGPYQSWLHRHTFVEADGGTHIIDSVRYQLPLGLLGIAAHRLKVRSELEAIFDFRATRIRELLTPAGHEPDANSLPVIGLS
jgi:ligand-binding SRPBCC domain-containing protein